MSRSTISTRELFEMFPDAETAREYIESRRWPSGSVCPKCGEAERVTKRKGGYYRCGPCLLDYTARTGTIFERSHVPLHLWLYAMYLLVTARKGISSLQLAKEIGCTQKTAWFMLQRIREACGNDTTLLGGGGGTVEIDETYIGGKERNKHESKRQNAGRGAVGKIPVIGMRERGGRTKALPIQAVDSDTVYRTITANVLPQTNIHTDEHSSYQNLDGLFYRHDSVNHGAKEYRRGRVTTNGIESVWAVMKRGVYGVYHHTSEKHLGRYVNEFTFRLNDGNVRRHSLDRLGSLLTASFGRRITFQKLTEASA